MTTEDRLQKLENNNRWLRTWCVGLTVICGGMFLMGAGGKEENRTVEEIRAKRILTDFLEVGRGGVTVSDVAVAEQFKASNLVMINASENGATISINERTEKGELIPRSELKSSNQGNAAVLALYSRERGLDRIKDRTIPLRPELSLVTHDFGTDISFFEDYSTRINLANIKKGEFKDSAWIRIRDKRGEIVKEWLTK